MQSNTQKNQIQNNQSQKIFKKDKYKYLYPSTLLKQEYIFKRAQFDLIFPQIKNSPIDQNIFETIYTFISSVSHKGKYPKYPITEQDHKLLEEVLPIMKPNFQIKTQNNIRFTWIGHSTALLQIGKDNILIDPVFYYRNSKFQSKSRKRYRQPACFIQQLPKIDVILISHDHYDHLDQKAIKQINQKFSPYIMAGIGSNDVLPQGNKTILFDWMQTKQIKLNQNIYKITFVPVCHWSRRGINDFNTRLWGGFVLQTPYKQKIFYSGDTGYCQVFKQIGDYFGPFDLTILPIGAYQPRQLLKAQHVNPQQSVKIHKQLKSKQSIGVHWGTFPLGRQGFLQPIQDLQIAKNKYFLAKNQFITLKHGQSIILK